MRHDLPHMPSLGVSSLDSRPPWRHGGLLFCRLLFRQGHGRTRQGEGGSSIPTRSRRLFAPAIPDEVSPRQITPRRAAPPLPASLSRRRAVRDRDPAGHPRRRADVDASVDLRLALPLNPLRVRRAGAHPVRYEDISRVAAQRHRAMEYFSP